MRIRWVKNNIPGFTLIELLLVIVIVAVLAALLLPTHGGPRKARAIVCMMNLKQLQLGFIMFASDHGDKLPAQISVADGGSREFIQTDHAFLHFEKIVPYCGSNNLPRLLVCPADRSRQVATNLQALNNLALSYFLNVDASATNNPPKNILIGERNLQVNRQPVVPGLLTVTTNQHLDWVGGIHTKGGNVGFADGHCIFVREGKLNEVIQQQPAATNRFAVP